MIIRKKQSPTAIVRKKRSLVAIYRGKQLVWQNGSGGIAAGGWEYGTGWEYGIGWGSNRK